MKKIFMIKELIESENNIFLCAIKINKCYDYRIHYICTNNHVVSQWFRSWKRGHRCKYCAIEANRKYTYDYFIRTLKNEKCIPLSILRKKDTQKTEINYICQNGHFCSQSLESFTSGKRCKECSYEKRRHSYGFIKKQIEIEGYKLISKNYTNGLQKLDVVCDKGHKIKITWNNWQSGSRCRKCFSESISTRWKEDKEFRKEMSKKRSIYMKKRWKDSEYQKYMTNMWKKTMGIKPTKPEITLNKLLNKLFPNEYKYVGDFKFWIDGKNPDFMNINGKKKLIELFGDYWHKDDNPEDRINHFKPYGFDTLVIWESELKNKDEIIGKLKEFHNG